MTAADALVRVLEAEGVEYVFGIPGSHILPFFDALARSGKIKVILTKHEEGAAFMARMYIRASGKPAVCVGTSGPGATNFATGIADAYCENIPLILITGQVATPIFGLNADQEATGEDGTPDQVAMYKSMTKMSSLAIRADSVPRRMREAFRVAWSPPYGPVHLCIPSDVQSETIAFQPMAPSQYRITSWNRVDTEQVEKAAEMIAASARPALIVGHRAVFPDASPEIDSLVSELGIPVATTVTGKGVLDESHPLCLGVLHLFGHRLPSKYLEKADCVVAVGENFMENACNYYDPGIVPSGGIVQIDDNPHQVGKIYPLALGVGGDIKATLKHLCSVLKSRGYNCPVGPGDIASLKEQTEHFAEPTLISDAVPLKPQRFFRELSEALPDGAALQVDIGKNFFWSLRYFKARKGAFFGTWAFQSMGVGAAAAVGLSLARPGKPVVCVCGDGSMQMNGMEIATAVHYKLPVTWVVFDDRRLNMIYLAQGLCYEERYIASEMTNPDFVQWAQSYGATAIRVDSPAEIRPALDQVLECRGPALIALNIDSDEILPLKPRVVLMTKKMGLDITDSSVSSRAFRKILDER